MAHYYTPEEVEKIKELADTAIMTGHFGDGKNFENGMRVLDCVEETMKMINSAQKRYDEDNQSKDGRNGDGKNGDGKNGDGQSEDDTKPGQIKGSPRQGTGKNLTK